MDAVVNGDDRAAVMVVGAWLDGGGQVDAVLLSHDRTRAGTNATMLMLASAIGRIKIVDLLLERNAEVDRQDSNGNTALTYAACQGCDTIVRRLLKAGAQIRLRGRWGGGGACHGRDARGVQWKLWPLGTVPTFCQPDCVHFKFDQLLFIATVVTCS